MTTYIWVNSGSGYTLLPDGTKPLPEPISSEGDSPRDTSRINRSIRLKFTFLEFHWNSPGTNGLIWAGADDTIQNIIVNSTLLACYGINSICYLEELFSSSVYRLLHVRHHHRFTHWGMNKMTDISYTGTSNAFSNVEYGMFICELMCHQAWLW